LLGYLPSESLIAALLYRLPTSTQTLRCLQRGFFSSPSFSRNFRVKFGKTSNFLEMTEDYQRSVAAASFGLAGTNRQGNSDFRGRTPATRYFLIAGV